MKKSSFRIIIVVLIAFCVIVASLFGSAWFSNKMKTIKGELIGNNFTLEFYDHFGNKTLTVDGKKVGVKANYLETKSIDSEGIATTNYELSSVTTITVDGNEIAQTGNTVIFVEEGLTALEDFELPATIETQGGTINIADRNINKLKNILGTEKVIIICSQLGVPIAVYGGKDVYWEVPDDLPKTTKLSIDGHALYVHRSDYILIDKDMIK